MTSAGRSFRLGRCSTSGKPKIKSEKGKMTSVGRSFRLGRCSMSGKPKNKSEKGKKKRKTEELTTIQEGDIVNLSDLLFTKNRDYLIKNTHNQKVMSNQLVGKVVVLHFLSLALPDDMWMLRAKSLMDIYNHIHHKGCFEVVFVAVMDSDFCYGGRYMPNCTLQERFQNMFSAMPWPAIPFSDIKSRKHLETKFRIPSLSNNFDPVSFVIDETGLVMQSRAECYFCWYGASGYPFSEEKLVSLASEDDDATKHPSVTKLLASPERNYVISNKNKKVSVCDLEDKVVALYLYEDIPGVRFTEKLKMAYRQLADKKNFEVVLLYINDTIDTYKTNEDSFCKRFDTMPWLALPFKDPNIKKVKRIFNYPLELDCGPGPDPILVIIGPNGSFVEPHGANIFMNFGIEAYPFTRKRVAELEAEYLKKLKLDMLWDENSVFGQRNGPPGSSFAIFVPFSQIVGKRIIFLTEDDMLVNYDEFLKRLKARYLQTKGTDGEFEVIHVCRNQDSTYEKHVASVPWLTLPASFNKSQKNIFSRVFHNFGVGLLAFDRDGRVVRKATYPSFEREDMDFPFYAGCLEEETLIDLIDKFEWNARDDDDDDSPSNN